MLNIEEIKSEIIERLKPLNPDKVILFASYAYGTPNEESDIDLFLLKDNLSLDETELMILDTISEYHIEASYPQYNRTMPFREEIKEVLEFS